MNLNNNTMDAKELADQITAAITDAVKPLQAMADELFKKPEPEPEPEETPQQKAEKVMNKATADFMEEAREKRTAGRSLDGKIIERKAPTDNLSGKQI